MYLDFSSIFGSYKLSYLTMMQSTPELEVIIEPREVPETGTGVAAKGTGSSEQQEPPQRRSWWRTFLGME